MKPKKIFSLALNILLHSKLRSWLTIIGIVIGVAAIVAIVSIGEGAQASLQDRLGTLGADIITISPGFERAQGGFRGGFGGGTGSQLSGKNLTIKDIQVIRGVDGVLFIDGKISGRIEVFHLAQSASLSVEGVDPLAWSNMVTTEIELGRYLNPGDRQVVVLGSGVATSTFKEPIGVNTNLNIGGRVFKVVGILKSTGTDDNRIFMPEEAARDILPSAGNKFTSIAVKVSEERVDEIALVIGEKLAFSRHVADKRKDYTITTSKQTQERIADITSTFTIFLGAIAAVSLLVGAIGIANTMFTSVLEKTKEIGIMKAIGARNHDILLIFLVNSALVGAVGGIIGIGLGYLISSFLPNLISGFGPGGNLRTVVPISLLVAALSISIAVGMVAGAIPAYRASKLKPVDALRYE